MILDNKVGALFTGSQTLIKPFPLLPSSTLLLKSKGIRGQEGAGTHLKIRHRSTVSSPAASFLLLSPSTKRFPDFTVRLSEREHSLKGLCLFQRTSRLIENYIALKNTKQ